MCNLINRYTPPPPPLGGPMRGCEGRRMTRATEPDGTVMCNIINTLVHTQMHEHPPPPLSLPRLLIVTNRCRTECLSTPPRSGLPGAVLLVFSGVCGSFFLQTSHGRWPGSSGGRLPQDALHETLGMHSGWGAFFEGPQSGGARYLPLLMPYHMQSQV